MKITKLFLTLTMVFSMLSLFSKAAELSDTTVIQLRDVDVEASRLKLFTESGKTVIRISDRKIQAMPVQTTEELLRSVPGVDLRQRGQAGTQADISIRGGSFDQVLVMINGIGLTDPQTGHHNMNLPVEVENLTTVEVLHGPASKRYGSQAFSGAVNFSVQPEAFNRLRASVGYGSFNTFRGNASINLVRGKIRNLTTIGYMQSAGYRENTDFSRLNIYSVTQWKAASAGDFDLQLGIQEKSFGANGFYSLAYPNQFEHTSAAFAALSWNKKLGRLDLSARMHARRHYDRFELFRDFAGAAAWYTDHNYHQTDIAGGNFQLQYMSRIGKFSGGVALQNDHVYSTVLGETITEETDRPLNSYEKAKDKYFSKQAGRFVRNYFVDYAGSWKGFFVSAGASLSNSRDYQEQFNYGIELNYQLIPELVVFASVNTASRLPTFTDLYYRSATQEANPDLQPEHAATLEGGIKFNNGNLSAQGSVFNRRGTNIIDWVKFPESAKWQSKNLTALNTLGADMLLTYTFAQTWLQSLSLSYAFMQNDKEADGFDSKYALDYLRHQLGLSLVQKLHKDITVNWQLGFNDRAGNYTDFGTGNPVDYDPYLLADVRFNWKLSPVNVFFDLKNIFNTAYVDFGGLELPGFHANIGLKWEIL